MKTFSFIILSLLFFFSVTSFAQYLPSSPYIQNPALAIGYVDSCASFWLRTYDQQRGGFYTNIDKYGNLLTSWGTNKNMLTQSRNAYGLVRAYMLTSDTAYLNLARKALSWMYSHAWDNVNGGWYQEIDANGNPMYPTNPKTAFYQHYALLGIAAFYEATGDTAAWNWLMKGYQNLENYYWDNRTGFKGYYDQVNFNNTSPLNKSFNATVDAVTTHLLYLYLMTKDNIYKERLLEMADEIKLRLAGNMSQQKIGFVESFDSDWNWRASETMTLMGHVLKSGWCLARINYLFPDTSYINTAANLIDNVWQKGYDHVYGGPYKDFNRVTGEMLLWGLGDSAKAWWQMEQAVTAGLMMYDVTKESKYIQMADETLSFFMTYFVDHQYGEVYSDRKRRGGIAWNEAKASSGKAGYHSIELGYYVYLYGNLLFKHEPAVLNYNFEPIVSDREFLMTPFAANDSTLLITEVLKDGIPYTNYDPSARILNLPAGTGGHFTVTYGTTISGVDQNPELASDFSLEQNYPNPFNPTTQISFSLRTKSPVTLEVYDLLGSEVASLVNETLEAGNHFINFNASGLSSGIYFYTLKAGNFIQTKKMVLIK